MPDPAERPAEFRESVELDARGLICPLPVLKARKLLRSLPTRTTLRVLATDSGAPKDFEHFCATTGMRLASVETIDGYFVISLDWPP